jgi:hypothetical protein
MTCEHAEQDGAYVLGALSPAERLDFERHLATCEECARSVRELAGLPGLLSRVDVAVLEEPSDAAAPPVPDALLTNLVREVSRGQRRRRFVTSGLAAAAILAIAALGFSALRSQDDARPPAVAASAPALAMTPVGDVPVHARLALESVTWGTKLQLACTYAPDASWTTSPHAPTYTLYVRTRDGKSEEVGTWRSVEGRTMQLTAATAARRQDIASVEVRTADGRPILRLTS